MKISLVNLFLTTYIQKEVFTEIRIRSLMHKQYTHFFRKIGRIVYIFLLKIRYIYR